MLLMENDDENKVFTIGFRTPPEDSTGLPHNFGAFSAVRVEKIFR